MAIDWYVLAHSLGYEMPTAMLMHLYVKEKHSIASVAELLGVSTWAVASALRTFNVPIRQQGGKRGQHRD